MKLLLSVILATALCAPASAAIVFCYAGNPACNGESAWSARIATAGYAATPVDTFTNFPLPTTGILQTGGPLGSVVDGAWRDSVVNNLGATAPNTPIKTTTFYHADGKLLWGIGAFFDTSPGHGGHASGITITINGTQVFLLRNFTGFFGLYVTGDDERFSSVVLGTVPACWDGSPTCTGWEIFHLDDLRFAVDRERQTAVPEPSTGSVIGSVVAGLLLVTLFRKLK